MISGIAVGDALLIPTGPHAFAFAVVLAHAGGRTIVRTQAGELLTCRHAPTIERDKARLLEHAEEVPCR